MVYDEGIIQSYADGDTYKRGLEYYNKHPMEDFTVSIVPTDNPSVNRYFIDTWVASDTSDREYNVQVSFNDSSGFTSFHCDCGYFKSSYRRRGICKHIVAVLIKYFRDKSSAVRKERKELQAASLLGKLDEVFKGFSNDKKLLKIQVDYFNYKAGRLKNYCTLKLGCDRTYGIKDIEAFIEAVLEEKPYQINKNLTYEPTAYRFTGEGEALIEFLKELYELNQINRIGADYSRNRILLLEGKKFFIPERQLSRFFHHCGFLVQKATIDGKEKEIHDFREEDVPLSFDVSEDFGEVCINLQGEPPIPIDSDKSLFYYKNKIYKPTIEQRKLYKLLCEAMGGCDSSTLRLKGEKNINAYIISVLHNYSKDIHFSEDMQELYVKEELKSEAYVDKIDSGIIVRIVHRYGDISINPLEEAKDSGTAIRNISREKQIETLIEALGFQRKEEEYILSSEEKQFGFLKEGCQRLKRYCEVYYSDSFKNLRVYAQKEISLRIRLNKSNLIEVDLASIKLSKEDLKRIFKLIKQQKRYYRLADGNFIELENKELKKLMDFVDRLGIKKKLLTEGRAVLPVYKALAAEKLGELMSLENLTFEEEVKEKLQELKKPMDFQVELPKGLKGKLRGYQISGFQYLKYLSVKGFGGILADEMGLGKTIQAIAYLLSEKGKGANLIVCPTSLCFNWWEELKRFAPSLSLKLIIGDKREREEGLKDYQDYDVLITSYALLRNDVELYKEMAFNSFIIDEAQYIKNPVSQNASSVKEIKSRVRFALTGTPIENNLGELWSIFDFIMPGYLFSFDGFNSMFLSPITKDPESTAFSKLNALIRPFILRRVKKEVATELPDKISHRLFVGMTEEQKKLYNSYAAASRKELRKEIELYGFEKNRIKILGMLTRLRQLCCYPGVFVEGYRGGSGKVNALMELVSSALEDNHKILIFSQFTTVLKHIEGIFQEKAINYYYLDGTVDSEERYKRVEAFNNAEKPWVFLISLKAGGTGLNLSGADLVIHFDPWWNPAVEEQATDRAHRIGQLKSVEVIKLIAKGTIEEKVYGIQEKKRGLIDNILSEGRGKGFIKSFTEEELLELIDITEE